MKNPFETIDQRLSSIENLLLEFVCKEAVEEKSENLTVKEAAEVLKVSEQSVHNYIKRGFFSAKRLGRVLLIKRADLDEALTEVKSMKYKRA
ncbi:helix-turn-helix domain-containing protein [Aggregatimonas sangjinii]|uniref:Helix-turn-helix domain-containing protein n=1 Tax=Aggregatimonas sangjinii TaxID=2583587 RepID=A0A5B7SNH8_9FLAO|nr:helix-turn-helix domain-containing protein [Aggregatimonas sangjinii]QCX00116.1 helix-turn-helix domain-containing protein [Aggregatimonas sangjinii]